MRRTGILLGLASIRADLQSFAEQQQFGKVLVRFATEVRHDSFKIGAYASDGVRALRIQRSVFHEVGDAASEKRVARRQTHAVDFFTGTLAREGAKVVRIPSALDFSSAHHECTLTVQR